MVISGFHNMALKNLIFLFALIGLLINKSKVYGYENKVDSIFFHIYNQQFDKAENELAYSKQKLKPLEYNLLTTDLFWWKAISSNKENDFKILESYLSKKLSTSEKSSFGNNLNDLIYLNYSLRLMSINSQSLKMLKYFIRINKFIDSFDNSNLSIEEQNIFEIYKAIFNFSKSKLFFTGTQFKNDNIKILKKHLRSSNLLNKTIACYFLAKIYSEIEKLPEQAVEYYSKLCQLYPNNMIFKNELLSVQLKTKKCRLATN